MLTTQPAKAMQGKLDLPTSPDLFLVAATTALALGKTARISPVSATPLTETWCESLKGNAQTSFEEGACTVTPVLDDPSSFLVLPFTELPYRDLLIFMYLGMGKTVAFRGISQKRIAALIARGERIGVQLEAVSFESRAGLQLTNTDSTVRDMIIDENDISAAIGFCVGKKAPATFQVDYQLSHPMRHLAPALGFDIIVKSAAPSRETDPLARRMRFLQSKKRAAQQQAQLFTVSLDFSRLDLSSTAQVVVPGDEVLSAILVATKCIVSRGSFTFGNAPLEPWATQLFTFVRRMGVKLSVQESGRTAFGSTGMVGFQKTELTGKKMECSPLYQFIDQLPAMVVAACFADSQSVFRDLEDLRNDDPDGIELLESCIRALGARHGEMPDGIVVEGGRDFDGFDMRTPLPAPVGGAFAAAGLHCMGTTTIDDELVRRRWPQFESMIKEICEFRT